MPKKTRKQKIATEVRITKPVEAQGFTFTASQKRSFSTFDHTEHTQQITQDIRKTLLVGTLFVAFEFILYFGAPHLGW